MNRVEDLINSAKTNELLGELLHIKKEEEKKKRPSTLSQANKGKRS